MPYAIVLLFDIIHGGIYSYEKVSSNGSCRIYDGFPDRL